jgi:hypothetical protein
MQPRHGFLLILVWRVACHGQPSTAGWRPEKPSAGSEFHSQLEAKTAVFLPVQISVWDDEDIFSLYGSFPPSMQRCTVFNGLFEVSPPLRRALLCNSLSFRWYARCPGITWRHLLTSQQQTMDTAMCRWRAVFICCSSTTRQQWMLAAVGPSSVLREQCLCLKNAVFHATAHCAFAYVPLQLHASHKAGDMAPGHVPLQSSFATWSHAIPTGTCRTSSSWGHRQWSSPWTCGRNAAVRYPFSIQSSCRAH